MPRGVPGRPAAARRPRAAARAARAPARARVAPRPRARSLRAGGRLVPLARGAPAPSPRAAGRARRDPAGEQPPLSLFLQASRPLAPPRAVADRAGPPPHRSREDQTVWVQALQVLPCPKASLEVTDLAAGFILGPGGASVHQLEALHAVRIKSWGLAHTATGRFARRQFVVEANAPGPGVRAGRARRRRSPSPPG